MYCWKQAHIFWEETFTFSYFSWGRVDKRQPVFLRVVMMLVPIFSYQNTAHSVKELVIFCFSLFLFELFILCYKLPTILCTTQPLNMASTPQIHLLWVHVCNVGVSIYGLSDRFSDKLAVVGSAGVSGTGSNTVICRVNWYKVVLVAHLVIYVLKSANLV